MSEALKAKIREACLASLQNRDLYDAQVSAQLTKELKAVQKKIAQEILEYKTLGSLSENKMISLTGLEKLKKEIAEILYDFSKHKTLMFKNSVNAAYELGIKSGLDELVSLSLPFFKDLGKKEINKLSTKLFTQIDRSALDFLAQYTVTLSGDVDAELSDGIKKVLMRSIIDGKGTDDIVRELGTVIQFKDSFKKAGSKVFSNAQYRMEMIVRTEIARAHNQGRIKFFDQVGLQKLEWMTMADERTCPVCGPLDGKIFKIDQFPMLPAHPFCRCMGILSDHNLQVGVPEQLK